MDIPDKATGLTPRERQIVKDTWALAYKNSKSVGVELFIQLFTTYPHHQQKFPSFKNVPLSEMKLGNKKLEAHATNVMYSLATLVDNLEDVECLIELCSKIGENHLRRKVEQQAFLDVKTVLMKLLKEKLGSSLTPQGEEAWNKTLDLANKCIFQAMEDKKNKA